MPPPTTVCLNMIVKNESKVISRCLSSVRGVIDYWVIVDTGSTDGTQDVIRRSLDGLPGELHERPWKNFGHNRSEALALARGKADYTLIIDADEELVVPLGFRWPALTMDSYQIKTELLNLVYYRTQLVRSALDWRYVGVLHEYPACPEAHTCAPLDGLINRPRADGARSADPDKYKRDAAILEEALQSEPGNDRYVFYLGQSYRDAGVPDKALEAYRRRARMGGWAEETWYSMFQIARLTETLRMPEHLVVEGYLHAYQNRPTRAESLCELARYYRSLDKFQLAFLFASAAVDIPMPSDILFVDGATYAWRALDEFAISGYYVGKHAEALAANERLLASGRLPEGERPRILRNLAFCRDRVGPSDTAQAAPVACSPAAPRKHAKGSRRRR